MARKKQEKSGQGVGTTPAPAPISHPNKKQVRLRLNGNVVWLYRGLADSLVAARLATHVQDEEPKPKKRTYKRRDMTAEP